jgi:hypothetical protein
VNPHLREGWSIDPNLDSVTFVTDVAGGTGLVDGKHRTPVSFIWLFETREAAVEALVAIYEHRRSDLEQKVADLDGRIARLRDASLSPCLAPASGDSK